MTRASSLLLTLLLSLATLVGVSGVAQASTVAGQLDPGDTLYPGESLGSPDGRYQLEMQQDGNLVLYAEGHDAVADTNTEGEPEAVLFMQRDGNLVVRARGNVPVWSSGTDLNPGTVLQLQNDGALVLYGPGHEVLRVLFPPLEELFVNSPTPGRPSYDGYVDSPRPGNLIETPAGGTDAFYDGTRLIACNGLAKSAPGKYGKGVELACGLVTDTEPVEEMDSYDYFWAVACLPFGPACDILTDDDSAF